MPVTILTETELRQCVALDADAVEAIEDAFRALGGGEVVMPPILSLPIHDANGEVDVKTAYIPGLDSFAIKISPGFFDNPKLGLPSLNGLMILFSARTGLLEALLLDNGYLTDIRTAAAGAVAANHLAPKKIDAAGVLGTGAQARLQIKALALVRDFDSLLVWGRDADKAAAYAAEMSADLGIMVTPVPEARDVVADADVVVSTTPSETPIIESSWLHPGLHITAMGSDADNKNELDPDVITFCDVLVVDRLSQSRKVGELRSAIAAGAIGAGTEVPELGDIVLGTAEGRTAEDQVTVCDLTGTGVQDTAIARFAFERAQKAGLGTPFETT